MQSVLDRGFGVSAGFPARPSPPTASPRLSRPLPGWREGSRHPPGTRELGHGRPRQGKGPAELAGACGDLMPHVRLQAQAHTPQQPATRVGPGTDALTTRTRHPIGAHDNGIRSAIHHTEPHRGLLGAAMSQLFALTSDAHLRLLPQTSPAAPSAQPPWRRTIGSQIGDHWKRAIAKPAKTLAAQANRTIVVENSRDPLRRAEL